MGHEPVIVLDTHALVWWVSGDKAISTRARGRIRKALQAGPLLASAISIMEIATAVRRGRLLLRDPFEQWLRDIRALPEVRFEPISVDIARHAGLMGEAVSGDPADRIIAATAIVLQAKLVTADKGLAAIPGLETVW
jgi:PIN domain nuclease of toxin-antitoxin system